MPSDANQMAELLCSEVNVKGVCIDLGVADGDRSVMVMYKHDTILDRPVAMLDIYLGGVPQDKPKLAERIFLDALKKGS